MVPVDSTPHQLEIPLKEDSRHQVEGQLRLWWRRLARVENVHNLFDHPSPVRPEARHRHEPRVGKRGSKLSLRRPRLHRRRSLELERYVEHDSPQRAQRGSEAEHEH